MKHQALEIFNSLSLVGCKNQIILIETEKEIDFFDCMQGMNNIIFSPNLDKMGKGCDSEFTIHVTCDSIAKVFNYLKSIKELEFDYVLIDRIDLFDENLHKMKRGALIAGFTSMLCSKTILRGANLLITSQKTEYKLREISNQHYTI